MQHKKLDSEFSHLLNLLSDEEKNKNKILATYTLQTLTAIKCLQTLITNFRKKGDNE